VRMRRRNLVYDLDHLGSYDELMNGPLQRDEALLLYALVRVVRPATVVEIGFLVGHGSRNLLRAMDPAARLYAFDIEARSQKAADELMAQDARLTFRLRSQTEIGPDDIEGRQADLVFLDASHDLALNQETFARLQSMMAPRGILAVHDTGAVPRPLMEAAGHWATEVPELWVDDECEVAPDERAFVNWILEEHPGWGQLHLHSRRTVRCGLTLLQRSAPLPRPA